MWHEAEEAFSGGKSWKNAIEVFRQKTLAEHPGHDDAINKWSYLATALYPIYINYYKTQPDERNRVSVWEEVDFKVPYNIPAGHNGEIITIFLRGKIDCMFANRHALYIQENKTKGERSIDPEALQKTVGQNLQTMMYHIATRLIFYYQKNTPPHGSIIPKIDTKYLKEPYQIAGTLYNVIKRPLSDRYPIKQKKDEKLKDFLDRAIAPASDPKNPDWFIRYKIPIRDEHLKDFTRRVFNPLMLQLVGWWDSIQYDPFNPWLTSLRQTLGNEICDKISQFDPNNHHFDIPFTNSAHWQTPWGVYNSLYNGFRGDYFEFLSTGSRVGLEEIDTLFPELAPKETA